MFVMLMFVTSIFSGCAMDPNASNTEKGIATGAGTGAVAGALWGLSTGDSKNVVKGALIGAVSGAVIGGLVGWKMDYKERQTATYAQTKKRVSYNSKQGTVVNIETLNAKSATLTPNSNLDINGSYYVMSSNSNKDIPIKRVNSMEYYNNETKKYENIFDKEDEEVKKLGTNEIINSINLPKDAPDGNYKYILAINAEDKSTSRELPFSVVTKQGKRYIIIQDNMYAFNNIN